MSDTDKKPKKKKIVKDIDDDEIAYKKTKKKKHLKMKINEDEEEDMDGVQNENIEKHFEADEDLEGDSGKIDVKEDVESSWTKEDYKELIRRMEIQLPKNDTKSFSSRVEKLDWDKIQFGSHSVDECYDKWKVIRLKVRHYRLLSEVLEDAKSWVEQPWTSHNNKKKFRHPEQPPRPLTSFMLFYMDKKNKVIKRYPDLKMTEVTRLLGERYKALSEAKKAFYLQKAKLMQEEYKQNLSKFYEKHPDLMPVTKKKLVKNIKPLPPIKLYLKDKLQKHQGDENFNRHDFNEKYKDMWKNLSSKKKAFWIRLAKEQEEKYLEQYQEDVLHNDENQPATTYKSVISKEENAILDRLAGKPEKPPNSAYSLFSRLMLKDKGQNYVEGEPKNRMREIANKWRQISDEEKKAYAENVQHMHENYKLEFANYLESLPEDKRAEELAKVQPKKKPGKVKIKSVKKGHTITNSQNQGLFKNEPEKPPVTAWDLFKSEFIRKNSHLPSNVAYKQSAALWKTMSTKETEKYKRKHEQMKDKYMVDFEAFLKALNESELKEYSALKNAKSKECHISEDPSEEESSSGEEENSSASNSSSSEGSDSGVS